MCWISLMVTGFIGHSYIVLTVTVFNAVITEFPVLQPFIQIPDFSSEKQVYISNWSQNRACHTDFNIK